MSELNSTKKIIIHLSLAISIVVAFIFAFFYLYLPSTTNHGEKVFVPDLEGSQLSVAQKLLEDKNLNIMVYDSAYMDGKLPGTIINQTPKSGNEVKEGRVIYVSVVSFNTPQVNMPQLISSSVKQAEMVLKSYGLKLGAITFQPSANENAVLQQSINKINIETGQLIPKGSIVDLVVGMGLSESRIMLPNLVGLTYNEALSKLSEIGLELGSIVYDENNTENTGLVFKQKPEYKYIDSDQTIPLGSIIDIWIGGKQVVNAP